MSSHVLGDPLEPISVDDLQRVHGLGWYHQYGTSVQWYPVASTDFTQTQYQAAATLYVIPQLGDKSAYAGPPCGVCRYKARRLSGGCRLGQRTCTPELDAKARDQVWELGERVRVRAPESDGDGPVYLTGSDSPGANPLSARWPDGVPLLCPTQKAWVSALDPNRDGRLQKAAYIRPDLAYRTVTIPKADGRVRRLHVPCGPLMELQSRILERTLNRCVWPEYVAAYVPGRQLIDTAHMHAGKPIVITLDLKNFFGSTTFSMVHDALIETYGFMQLGALPFGRSEQGGVSVVTRRDQLVQKSALSLGSHTEAGAQAAVLYLTHAVTCPVDTRKPDSVRVLPQGAPTSGAFANLVGVNRLDPRILVVTSKWGFTYSRYADDLIFSRDTDLTRDETTQFIDEIVAAVFESGYRVNWKKLRVQRAHQQQRVLGLVVNDGTPRVPRKTRMLLRAQSHFANKNGLDAAAARNLPADMSFDDGVTPAEVFRRQHKGRTAYVRHVHADHARTILNLSQQQWNGPSF